jgi:hypothetical protein
MTEKTKNIKENEQEEIKPQAEIEEKEIDYSKPIVTFDKKPKPKAYFNYTIEGKEIEIIVPSKIPYSFLKSLLKFQDFIKNAKEINEEYFDTVSKVVGSILKMKNEDKLIDKLLDIVEYEDFVKINEAISNHITNLLTKKKGNIGK